MKEQLYTIPLMDAFRAEDECPFCFIERNLEQHALDFVLGPEVSYMQDHVRAQTDKMGFCRKHLHQMFAYGEALGTALIVDTHLKALRAELKKEIKHFSYSSKASLAERFQKDTESRKGSNNVSKWVFEKENSCFICDNIKNNYDRYMATFFVLFKKGEDEFMDLVKSGKGFCLHHLADVLDAAPLYLNQKQQKQLQDIIFPQMEEHLERLQEEIDWFEKKFDYRYRDAEWKNSRDALPRAIEKIVGGYPADGPYRKK